MYAQMLFLLKRLDAPDIILTYIWLLRTLYWFYGQERVRYSIIDIYKTKTYFCF
jgi:hypothetical protein